MTTQTDIINLALQSFGSRTTVTDAEVLANSTNETKQALLTYENTRDTLLRMAPWDCALKVRNLTYITSMPGTPENSSPTTQLWQPGQPAPGWLYEYQYPADCLRACWLNPVNPTGISDGVPIFPVATGVTPVFNSGPPVRFKVQTDDFYAVTAATLVAPGVDYVAQEIITLEGPATGAVPFGASAQIRVLTVSGLGAILTYEIVPSVIGETAVAGSYFTRQTATQAQGSTTGIGSGATFNLTFATVQTPQRVILTNQEYANLVYCRQVTNPNIWDPLFQDAMANALGADICMALTGDKSLANMCIARANNSISEARKADGNEGLTINDVTPDWIQVRGWLNPGAQGPFASFDWGAAWPNYM